MASSVFLPFSAGSGRNLASCPNNGRSLIRRRSAATSIDYTHIPSILPGDRQYRYSTAHSLYYMLTGWDRATEHKRRKTGFSTAYSKEIGGCTCCSAPITRQASRARKQKVLYRSTSPVVPSLAEKYQMLGALLNESRDAKSVRTTRRALLEPTRSRKSLYSSDADTCRKVLWDRGSNPLRLVLAVCLFERV